MTVDRKDKHRAFEREALPHMNLLYNFAMGITRSPSDADDMVLETYMKAYRFWHKYEQGTSLQGWLLRILKNTFISRYRQRAYELERVTNGTIQELHSGMGRDPRDSKDLKDHSFRSATERSKRPNGSIMDLREAENRQRKTGRNPIYPPSAESVRKQSRRKQ